ncbi:MAG: type II glyceraldehyde-3-phosphate dehydrogenase [Archaeoglobaceae archaeon]|nr:type II glyceraldehyde-3-phosphate dehydrogenase [Archaeoglobaceae archaeon]MDW8013021.1 type II glyceraldehyde-3-phosphate dehydrogenase [Archaeoglobaceae archaeon]
MVKVAVNGYGTIGKRVADAVAKQEDMKVLGVTKTKPDFDAVIASKKFDLYAVNEQSLKVFEENGIEVHGTVEDLLKKADIVIDCSPDKVGAENKKIYEKFNIKAIFQGGEKKNVAEISFNSLANYNAAVGKRYVRVVSCNTTALCRLIYTLKENFKIGKIRATILRRVSDPKEDSKGLMNAIMPDPINVPSHHGPDVKTVIPDVDIVTAAFKLPTTLMHVHFLSIEMKEKINPSDVLTVLENEPRILLVSVGKGFTSTAKIIEYAREFRTRYDLFENVVWKESINVDGNDLFITQAVHQEAIVVPENVDAIRAMLNLSSKDESIEKTNKSLGIGKLSIV